MRRSAGVLLLMTTLVSPAVCAAPKASSALPTITIGETNCVITQSCKVKPGVYELKDSGGKGAVQIGADNVTVDFGGAVIRSCDVFAAKRDGFEGIGINIDGRKNVTIKNAVVRGYKFNIRAVGCTKLNLVGCDVSYSRSEKMLDMGIPSSGMLWIRDLNAWRGYGSGIWMEKTKAGTVKGCRAINAQNGILIVESDGCLVTNNDCSFNSGWGIGLWASSDNVISWNLADYVDRTRNLEYGGDSAGFALTNASNRNYFVGNSITNGGDGFFLADYSPGHENREEKVLPQGACDDNIIAYNDGSWAPANAFEGTFSSDNIYYKNWAKECNYGFWLGFSRDTAVLSNDIRHNYRAGIDIEHGSGNRIENNTFEANVGPAVQLYSSTDKVNENHPSKNNEVRDNIFQNQQRTIALQNSTDYYIGGNVFKNSEAPTDLKNSKKPDSVTALKKFESSPRFKKLQQILATKPKDFKYFKDTPGPFGKEWLQMDEYSVRSFRDKIATYRSTGWGSLDLFVFGLTGTKISVGDKTEAARDPKNGRVTHISAVLANDGIGEVRPYDIKLTQGGKTQSIKGEFVTSQWKLKWVRWDQQTTPQAGDDAGWKALFSRRPIREETLDDTTWMYDFRPPRAMGDAGYAVEAATKIRLPAGAYKFAAGCDGGVRIVVDGGEALAGWQGGGPWEMSKVVELKDGVHDIVVTYVHLNGDTKLRFWLGRPFDQSVSK